MLSLRGYVFSRPIDGAVIPQRVQNLVMRHYAELQGYRYLLGAVEYEMPGCNMVLRGLLKEKDSVDGLVFYSSAQMPDDEDLKAQLLSTLHQGFQLHFALDQLSFSTQEGCGLLHDLDMGRKLSRQMNQMEALWNAT